VSSPVLYRTVPAPAPDPEGARLLRAGSMDAIAFASGSAARGFAALFGPEAAGLAGRALVACMGRLAPATHGRPACASMRSPTEASPSSSRRWNPRCCPQADQGPEGSHGKARRQGVASSPMNERPSILVVEDDDDCRTVLVDLLEMSGYSVLSCGEAHRAVEMARQHQPALVLVDFMMPDADGGGWCARCGPKGQSRRCARGAHHGSSAGREIAIRSGPILGEAVRPDRLLELVQTLAPMS